MRKYYKQNKNIIVKVLYIISFIIGLYTLFTIYNSYTYISGLVSNKGLVVSKQLGSVVSYYMNSSMPYVFYTISIWGIGYIIHKLDNFSIHEINNKKKPVEMNSDVEEAEEELDYFLKTLKDKPDIEQI